MASSGLAKLDAVNLMLEAVSQYPASSLDTGGTSPEARAETILDRACERILSEGWQENIEYDVELTRADTTKYTVAIDDATFTNATKTLTKVGGFTDYTEWDYDDQIYISLGTAVTAGWYEVKSRTSDDAIILKDDITTNASSPVDVDTTLVGWEDAVELETDILRVATYVGSLSEDLTMRNGKLYDRENNTFSLDSDPTIVLVRNLDFVDLTPDLKYYISIAAKERFQRALLGAGQVDDQIARELGLARMKAVKTDAANARYNPLRTLTARRILGLGSASIRTR